MFKCVLQDSISSVTLDENTVQLLDFIGIPKSDYQNFDYARIYKSNFLCNKLLEGSAKSQNDGIFSLFENIFSQEEIDIGVETFCVSSRMIRMLEENEDSDEDNKSIPPEEEQKKRIEQQKKKINSWIKSNDIILPQDIQSKVSNYDEEQIEALKKLPWFAKEKDKPTDLKKAEGTLNQKIFGLSEVKNQILQYMAAQINTNSSIGTVLLLDGPPGIGKTSIASAIADAMDRKLYTIKIPAYNTAWEFCGLDKSWKSAKPGLIIEALISTKSSSPIILLDEIDKIPATQKDSGNIAAALLTVLDSDRSHYRDSFLGIDIDLSEVIFLATSNDINNINPVLRDRMKIISLKGYTGEDKKIIAQQYIIPQKRKAYNLFEEDLIFEDDSLKLLVNQYAIEPGVRTLMHDLDSIFSYASKYKLDGKGKLSIGKVKIYDILGEPRVKSYSVGTIGGIGDCLSMDFYDIKGRFDVVQATVYPGKGNIKRTGSLGNKDLDECIDIVISHVKKFSLLYGIEYELINSSDIHINFLSDNIHNSKEYALAIFVAVICAFKGWCTRSWVFLGRITLNGSIIPPESLSDKVASFNLSDKVDKLITTNLQDVPQDKELESSNGKIVFLQNTMQVYKWLEEQVKGD